MLQSLIAHVDPTPFLPKYLISPILPQLYSLYAQLERTRTADPSLKELVKGLLRVWGGTADVEDAIGGWWNVMNSGNGWGFERSDVGWSIVGESVQVEVNK